MKTVRSYHTATLLPNGKVFVTGDGGAVSAELYDPITRSWTTTSNSIDHFNAETATLLPDGNVLLVGGYNGIQGTSGDVGIAGAELYDPGVGVAPSASPSTTPPVTRPPVVAPPVATPSPSPSVIPPGAPRWTAIGSKLTVRQGPTVRLLRDGRVLVFGGLELLASAELYDPATGTSAATGSMVTHAGPRSWLTSDSFTATLLRDGKVLVAGGSGDSITESLASAELYDPASGTWTATGNMVTAHGRGSTATLLPDGKVLVAGGDGGSGATATAELYDPANGTWTTTGSMVTPRFGHTATLLADGNVLVAGGVGYPVLASAELYHPDSGTWTATGSMARPRVGHTTAPGHTATLLSDGRVLVVGGNGGSAAAVPRIDAELYDPATGTWTATRSMVTPRFEGQTATLLLDGRVLVAGGSDFQVMPGGELGRITALASAELFEPATGSWTATASMGKPREGQTAMLLPDGTVLVVGGSNYNPAGYLTVELYDSGTGN
jgi:N-acetylneuraminic acid mutarotase